MCHDDVYIARYGSVRWCEVLLSGPVEVSAEDSLEGIIEDIQAIKDSLTKATKDIEIQSKVNEIQDQKIEAVRLKATNPLAN